MKEWDPDAALSNLAMEKSLDNGDDVVTAARVFRENAVPAAQSIVHLALYSGNESLRFRAAQYVIERNMGRVQDGQPVDNDPLTTLFGAVTREAEAVVRRGGE